MSLPTELPVNHHADHPGFSGVAGAAFALVFLLVGRANARVAVEAAAVSTDDTVVDIGCGPGEAARQAALRGATVIGVDPSSVMLRVARRHARRGAVDFKQGTAESLPVPDGWATVVWSLATVHHWRDVRAGLSEAHRVLARGGRLVAVERQSPPEASGLASHGWTRQQAETFAAQASSAGFDGVRVDARKSGRRDMWVVTARRT